MPVTTPSTAAATPTLCPPPAPTHLMPSLASGAKFNWADAVEEEERLQEQQQLRGMKLLGREKARREKSKAVERACDAIWRVLKEQRNTGVSVKTIQDSLKWKQNYYGAVGSLRQFLKDNGSYFVVHEQIVQIGPALSNRSDTTDAQFPRK